MNCINIYIPLASSALSGTYCSKVITFLLQVFCICTTNPARNPFVLCALAPIGVRNHSLDSVVMELSLSIPHKSAYFLIQYIPQPCLTALALWAAPGSSVVQHLFQYNRTAVSVFVLCALLSPMWFYFKTQYPAACCAWVRRRRFTPLAPGSAPGANGLQPSFHSI